VPNILQAPYDLQRWEVTFLPSPIVQHRGDNLQVVAALGFGPDGLYFAPLFPDQAGETAIIKISYSPDANYPYQIQSDLNPITLMNSKGCFACHTLYNNGGGAIGPVLDRDLLVPRVLELLESTEYIGRSQSLNATLEEPYASFREARQSILELDGPEKVRTWVENRIQEPRFDDPDAIMPNLGISQEQAASIAGFLVGVDDSINGKGFFGSIRSFAGDRLPEPTRRKHLVYFFAVGLLIGGLAIGAGCLGYAKLQEVRSRSV
jgi:hypothetical protein